MAQKSQARGRGCATSSRSGSAASGCTGSTSGPEPTGAGVGPGMSDPGTRLTLVNAAGGGPRAPMRTITSALPNGTKDTILVSL